MVVKVVTVVIEVTVATVATVATGATVVIVLTVVTVVTKKIVSPKKNSFFWQKKYFFSCLAKKISPKTHTQVGMTLKNSNYDETQKPKL